MKRQFMAITLALSVQLIACPLPVFAASKPAHPTTVRRHASVSRATASSALQQGIRDYNRGFILRAIPRFEQATRQAPGDAMAWLWLARAHRRQGMPADFVKAATAYQKVLAINPGQVEALASLGEFWSWDPARREEAIHLLKKAHTLAPGDADIARKLAEALLWNDNPADALAYAEPVAHRYAADRHWMGEYAQMLTAAGRLDEAMAIYNTTLRDEVGRNLDVKMDLARLYAKRGEMERAQAVFADIRRMTDGLPAARRTPDLSLKMASLAFELGLYEESAKWDQSLPDALQRRKDIQLRMARALGKTERASEAIALWNGLYEAGLLSPAEKLEAADFLRGQDSSTWPSPGIVDALYQEAAKESDQQGGPGIGDAGEIRLRLARRLAQDDPENTHFNEAVQAYRQAMASPDGATRATARKELLDYLKSDKDHPEAVENAFRELAAAEPEQVSIRAAYAEYVSWQPDRRPEALRLYAELAKTVPEERETWEGHLEEVLKWHKPSTALIPIYQSIVDVYPDNKVVRLAVARAYRNDPDYYREAVETYADLVQREPDDGTIKKEWLNVLLANPARRDENIRLLKGMLDKAPSPQEADPDVQATYAKLLSYAHKYGPAMEVFDRVLAKNPAHRDALLGKGYVILWSGRKLEAKRYFREMRQKYPDDVDIAFGLAQADKLLGRYDEALRLLQEIRPLLDQAGDRAGDMNPQELNYLEFGPESEFHGGYGRGDVRLVAHELDAGTGNPLKDRPATYDFSIEPVTGEQKPVKSGDAQLNELRSEIQALSDAVESLKLLQTSANAQLQQLDRNIHGTRDALPYEMELPPEDSLADGPAGGLDSEAAALPSVAGAPGAGGGRRRLVGENGLAPQYGTYSALDYDTNPLLSGLGRFRKDDATDLEKGLTNDLRPLIRAGFMRYLQDGAPTTTRLRGWGFPNQIALSLTPQIRLRGGIQPTHWYLPDGVSPASTWGIQYGLGATVKYWDRLTLDGDIALTRFTQSQSTNLTFQTQLQYDINDSIRAKLGVRRIPQYNSLLTLTGQRPDRGAFRGDVVGQARENGIYAELNTHPLSPNWDWNLGYEWAFIDGARIPNNRKNQAYTSLGYTWHYGEKQQVRLGYEFLYFGYAKNATNGFFDTTSRGLTRPLASLDPPTLASRGYVFGGYYSPSLFLMNAARLDFRGSLFNRFLEYKLGGSLGVQTTQLGHHIREDGNRSSLASAFDANVILNFTDWLAAYGDVDFLDAGGQFNRWRFGGGLILRPGIDALSPVLGGQSRQGVPSKQEP